MGGGGGACQESLCGKLSYEWNLMARMEGCPICYHYLQINLDFWNISFCSDWEKTVYILNLS